MNPIHTLRPAPSHRRFRALLRRYFQRPPVDGDALAVVLHFHCPPNLSAADLVGMKLRLQSEVQQQQLELERVHGVPGWRYRFRTALRKSGAGALLLGDAALLHLGAQRTIEKYPTGWFSEGMNIVSPFVFAGVIVGIAAAVVHLWKSPVTRALQKFKHERLHRACEEVLKGTA